MVICFAFLIQQTKVDNGSMSGERRKCAPYELEENEPSGRTRTSKFHRSSGWGTLRCLIFVGHLRFCSDYLRFRLFLFANQKRMKVS